MIGFGVTFQAEAFYPHELGVGANIVFLVISMIAIANMVWETERFEVLQYGQLNKLIPSHFGFLSSGRS